MILGSSCKKKPFCSVLYRKLETWLGKPKVALPVIAMNQIRLAKMNMAVVMLASFV